jgi:hypothetical protein
MAGADRIADRASREAKAKVTAVVASGKSPDQIERERAAQIKRDQVQSAAAFKQSGLGVSGFVNKVDSQASAPKPQAPSAPARPAAPAVDQAALDRAAQAERDRLAQLERDRLAQIERERLAQLERERLARLEKERLAAIERARQEAIARMPRPLVPDTREPVRYATPEDVLIDENDMPVELILKLTLEKIGGLELINLVRHDTVNGQNIIYRPIKNVSQLAIDYNPQNMIKMPGSGDAYFKNFAIKLENHIPQDTNLFPPTVAYIDSNTENVIIELVNTKADYEIEVQMVSSGKVFDGTIYTEDIS